MNPIRSGTPFRWILALLLAVSVSGTPWRSLGQPFPPPRQSPPPEETNGTSTTVVRIEEREKKEQSNSFLRPSVGRISFEDENIRQGRWALGALIDLNVSGSREFLAGPSFGLLYSSIDDQGTAAVQDNDFILQVPAQLKLAWIPKDAPRLSIGAHGGINVLYSQGTTAFGAEGGDEERWNAYASVGADLGFRVGRTVEIAIRPDWTFLDEFRLFTLTLGLGIAI